MGAKNSAAGSLWALTGHEKAVHLVNQAGGFFVAYGPKTRQKTYFLVRDITQPGAMACNRRFGLFWGQNHVIIGCFGLF